MNPPIIHRDIKPENIMLSEAGTVKLMDFDIARTYDSEKNRDTEYMGTVGYASPEHFGFGQTDIRSDIYSCGVLLNYLLTGHIPENELAEGQYGIIVKKCIEVNPIHRYQNILQLQQALHNAIYLSDNITFYNEKQTIFQAADDIQSDPTEQTKYTQTNTYSHTVKQDNVQENQLHQNIMKKYNTNQQIPIYPRKWQKYLPPGFRTLNIFKMGIAIFFYSIFIGCAITYEVKDAKSQGEIIINRIFCGIGLISSVLVLFNYLGITDRLSKKHYLTGWKYWGMQFLYAFTTLLIIISIMCIIVEIYNGII